MYVLLIDDDVTFLKIAEWEFNKNSNLTLYTATSCKIAKIILNKQKIDLIICDHNMPFETGLNFIKNERISCEIPIISITSEENLSLDYYKAGVIDHIVKPINFDNLIMKIENMFSLTNTNKTNYVFNVNKDQSLTKNESIIYNHFISNQNVIIAKNKLFSLIDKKTFEKDRTIDVLISKINKKIGNKKINSIRGKGYVYK